MTRRGILTVYRKEILEALRDRRTLISMIVIPVVVMPALMLGMGGAAAKIVMKARQEIPRVMIIGGEDSPGILAEMKGVKAIEVVPTSPDFTNRISEKSIRAAVEIPKGFAAALAEGQPVNVQIFIYGGEIKSIFAAQALEQYFQKLREKVLNERLAERNFPPRLLHPFETRQVNVAPPKKVSGNFIGAIIPYILILMCMTGAMHPAIDVTAGEKDRGTIETLLCSPVSRTDLVLGKFLLTLTAALGTTFLSLTATGLSFLLLKGAAMGQSGFPSLVVDPGSLLAVFAMMLPIAMLFSAVMLAIALFSRSPREANSYLQPMLIVTILPAVASLLPGVDLNARLALVPILNVSLICKEILSGTYHWNYILFIIGSTLVYASIALAAAVRMFNREEVLFRT